MKEFLPFKDLMVDGDEPDYAKLFRKLSCKLVSEDLFSNTFTDKSFDRKELKKKREEVEFRTDLALFLKEYADDLDNRKIPLRKT